MRFGFFTFILAIGVFGSILSNGLSRGSSRNGNAMQDAIDAQARDYAEARAQGDSTAPMDGTIELSREDDGHFYADVQVNGATLHMLVDTGASEIALSREDARTAGLGVSIGMPEVVGRGADGDVHGEIATLDRVALGEKTVEGLQAVVLNSGEQSLLGQSFLSKFDTVQIQGDKMFLR
jgi:aspartyl protease family protein